MTLSVICTDRNVQNPQHRPHPRHCDDIGEGRAGGAVSDIGDPVKGQSVPPEPFHLKAPSWQGRSGGQGHENHGDNLVIMMTQKGDFLFIALRSFRV